MANNGSPTKAELRAQLEEVYERTLKQSPDLPILYAAEPLPERRKYRPKKRSDAYQEEVAKLLATDGDVATNCDQSSAPAENLDEYPGLTQSVKNYRPSKSRIDRE